MQAARQAQVHRPHAGAAAAGLPSDPAGLTTWAERLAPWRSYLTAHLWRAAPVRAPRKTTTSKKLAIQLKVMGFEPINISLDDYFVDRSRTPRDEEGNYDFECLEALDVEYLNEQLVALFAGYLGE